MADHFSNNCDTWKRVHSRGGGVLRFYGIHLIAFLAKQGYETVQTVLLSGDKPDEPDRWEATFLNGDRCSCVVTINSRSNSSIFRIDSDNGETLLSLEDPFDLERPLKNLDRRVPVLTRMLADFDSDEEIVSRNDLYERIIELWRLAEN